jgi:hypothetical protein
LLFAWVEHVHSGGGSAPLLAVREDDLDRIEDATG